MTQTLRSDVCIVGDGAIGKAAALGLAQAGFRVILLGDAAPPKQKTISEQWDVRVFALNHVAHTLLDSLKVWQALDANRIEPVDAMHVFDAVGHTDGKIQFDAYGAFVDELAWIVEDKNLSQALDAALQFSSNIIRKYGKATELSVLADHACIQLESGEQIEAALVIGADGAQSWVRGRCDIGWDYRDYHQQGVVTNFHCEKPHCGIAHQWFVGQQGIIALLPLPNQQVSLVWSAPNVLAQELLTETAQQLADRLAIFAHEKLGALTPLQPEVVKAFPLRLIKPHAMIAERVAFIGDAAHVIHPLAGHGMNLGFADVQSLLTCLAEKDAHTDCGDARLLRRYQRMRKEEVALMQMATDGLERLFSSELSPVKMMRNKGLNLLNQFPAIKRKLITQALGR